LEEKSHKATIPEDGKMKNVFVFMCLYLFCAISFADIVVYFDDYEDHYDGEPWDPVEPWNWSDNGGFHEVFYRDYDGSIVVEHYGGYDNSAGTAAVDTRFGSQWGIELSGNTSSNPADYTISFDVINLDGGLDPLPLELWVLPLGQGYGTGFSIGQADGWVHVSHTLDNLTATWWAGTAWDLTSATWTLEVGGPAWPGIEVAAGDSWEQTWLFDNLMITMVPEPATMVLLGLGSLLMLRKRQ
jgi:hypothetical protein